MLGFPLTEAVLLLGMPFHFLSDKLLGAIYRDVGTGEEATRDGPHPTASTGGVQFAVSKSDGTREEQ